MKIIQLPFNPVRKQSLQKARRSKATRMEAAGQMNLFDGARVVPLNQDGLFHRAAQLDDAGVKGEARTLYKQCIDQDIHPADAWCNLGVLDYENQDAQTALLCFTSCLKLNPAHAEAHYNLGNIYSDLGNLPLAEFHYQASIQFNSRFANSYFNLAILKIKANDPEKAIEFLRRYCEYANEQEQANAQELVQKIQEAVAS